MAGPVRRERDEIGEAAKLVDLDDEALLFRLVRLGSIAFVIRVVFRRDFRNNLAIIRMVSLREPVARGASAAGKAVVGRFAQHRGRKRAGKFRLADAARPMDEERVGKPLARRRDALQDFTVPRQGRHRMARSKASPSLARTASIGAAASITWKRCGCVRARSRYACLTRPKKSAVSRSKLSRVRVPPPLRPEAYA